MTGPLAPRRSHQGGDPHRSPTATFGLLGARGRGAAERAAIARAAERLGRLALYARPLDTARVRILHVPWLFALPWFRRFTGYNMGHLILLARPLDRVTDDLITHELCHVWQDQDHRARMWSSYVLRGYARNPHEIEARRAVAETRPAAER